MLHFPLHYQCSAGGSTVLLWRRYSTGVPMLLGHNDGKDVRDGTTGDAGRRLCRASVSGFLQ